MGAADGFFNKGNVILCLLRQSVVLRNAADVTKAVHIFIDRLAAVQRVADGERVDALAVQFIRNTDGNFLIAGQNVKFCQCKACCALHGHTVAGSDDVKAAYAPRAPRCSAVFAAGLAKKFSIFVKQFAGKGTFANAA